MNNNKIHFELRKALQKLDTHHFKIFFTILTCYWNDYKIFISSQSFFNLWCELNRLCHEIDESFPDPYDDRNLIKSYCLQHPYYFIDILPSKVVLDLFSEHLDDRLDILIGIAKRLATGDLRASFEYINKSLELHDNVDELVDYTLSVVRTFAKE